MKTPLHDSDYEGLAVQAWTLEADELAGEFAKWANAGDVTACRWMNRLYRYGMSTSWLDLVDRLVRKVELVHTYRLVAEEARFELKLRPWGRTHPIKDKPLFPDVETVFAWVLMKLVNDGIDKKVKRCEADDCRAFHFRRGKWCSDSCGSRIRLRLKRKKDKERQML